VTYLLDTNVVSELRKRRPNDGVLAWSETVRPTQLFLSVVTVWEIDIGIRLVERRDPAQGKHLRDWLSSKILQGYAGRILGIDLEVAQHVGSLHVPERDALIAATASVHSLTIVTRNEADFAPMGRTLINPWR